MILVLCEPEDTCGLWLTAELNQRGCETTLVMPDEFAIGSRFSLKVLEEGDIATVQLSDGRIIDSSNLTGVINRMENFPRPSLINVSDSDVIYACEEMRAATVAWFASLNCPILNSPTPYSAIGFTAHEAVWRHRVEGYGIRSAPLIMGGENEVDQYPDISVVAIGETVLAMEENSAPNSIIEASTRLLYATGFNLLGLDFSKNSSGEWEFLRVHMMPNLIPFGSRVVDTILTLMVR